MQPRLKTIAVAQFLILQMGTLRPGRGKDLSKVTQGVSSQVTIWPYPTPPGHPGLREMVIPSEFSLISHQSHLPIPGCLLLSHTHQWERNWGNSETSLPWSLPARTSLGAPGSQMAGDLRTGVQKHSASCQSRLPGLADGSYSQGRPSPISTPLGHSDRSLQSHICAGTGKAEMSDTPL